MQNELQEQLYPTFLKAFNEQSFRPCRLFIVAASLKDGLTISHASAEKPEDAWSVVAKKYRGGGVIRIEFVTASRRVTWADCLEEIRSVGVNRFPHGIAFDKDWRIALTEQELNELLKPQDDAPLNTSELQEYCRRRFECDFPNLAATDEVELFDTTKIFFQEGMNEPATNILPLRVGVLQEDKNKDKKPGKTVATGLMTYMAKNFNIEMYFFTSQDIDFEKKMVKANLIEGKKFVNKVISLPRIIYNIPEAISGSDKNRNLKLKLEKYGCYFVRPVLSLSKQAAYDMLSNNTQLREYLIETHTLKNFEHFLSLLEQYHNDVIVKPTNGGGGVDVFRITFNGEKYIVNVNREESFFNTVEELKTFYDKNFNKREQILQPYIVSRTKNGNPFDVRIHIFQAPKDSFYPVIYARIGNAKGIISNIHGGGHPVHGVSFLKEEFGDDWKVLYDKLLYIGKTFPRYFQTFFKEKFFAIALDVGIQRRENSYDIKFFEINSRSPGMTFIERESALASLEYLQYLGKNLDGEFIKP